LNFALRLRLSLALGLLLSGLLSARLSLLLRRLLSRRLGASRLLLSPSLLFLLLLKLTRLLLRGLVVFGTFGAHAAHILFASLIHFRFASGICLLLLLALRHGRVVTRREVTAHFYSDDPGAAGLSNIVDVYVRFLRKKIDEGFWPRLILTRRGRGYLLRAPAAG